jgi:hypothetical protein
MKPDKQQIGVGATGELSLRVSVASLIKIMFTNPGDGRHMLALERTATMQENQGKTQVLVKAKPFGGAVRLVDVQALRDLIGDFHYDSQRSRREADMRIQIDPGSWERVKQLCWEQLRNPESGILDYSPDRELEEEFTDTLHLEITQYQYQVKLRTMIFEDQPVKTENVRTPGSLTQRIYYIFEAQIESKELIASMLANHQRYTDQDLKEIAFLDAQQGGRGRANAVLALPSADLVKYYRSLPVEIRSEPLLYGEHPLAENVLACLEEVVQTRYKSFGS